MESWYTPGSGDIEYRKQHAGDYTGDGLTDILLLPQEPDGSVLVQNVKLWKSSGKNFSSEVYTNIQDASWFRSRTQLPGDYNGDGKTDLALMSSEEGALLPVGNVWVWKTNSLEPDLITTIDNSSGSLIDVFYKPAPQWTGEHRPIIPGSSYPEVANKAADMLVEKLEISDGLGTVLSYEYEYHNRKSYMGLSHEKKGLCFEWVKRIAPDDSAVQMYFHQDDPDLAGSLRRKSTYGNDGELYSMQEFFYGKREEFESLTDNYHAVKFIYNKGEYSYNYNATATADTYFTQSAFYDGTGDLTSYDSFGRNTRQKDYGLVLRTPGDPWDSFSDLLGFSDNSEQVKVHCNKEDPYILAPTEVLMYSCALDPDTLEYDNALSLSGHTRYYYDSNDTLPGVLFARSVYDAVGRVIKSYNPEGNFKQTVYKKRQQVTIDELGHAVASEVIGPVSREYTFPGVYDRGDDVDEDWTPLPEEYSVVESRSAYNATAILTWDETDTPHAIVTETNLLGWMKNYCDPDMGEWLYTYDNAGNLLSRTDAVGKVLNFTYDELNRMTEKKYGNTIHTEYYYDESGHGFALGELTRLLFSDGSYAESYTYDELGNVSVLEKSITGQTSRSLQRSYDPMGRVIEEIYPDGEVVNYSYETDGNLDSVYNGNYNYVADIDYSPTGKVTRTLLGNGVAVNYGYAVGSDRLISLTTDLSNRFYLEYGYDDVGNILTRRDYNYGSLTPGGYTEEYSYDEYYRLTGAVSPAGLYGTKSYVYDKMNNILAKDGKTYTYGSSRPHAVTAAGTHSFVYDGNGNMTMRLNGGVTERTISYDYENRVSSMSDGGVYSYDDNGQRVKKVENGVTTYYFFPCYEVQDDGSTVSSTSYYFANEIKVAQKKKVVGDPWSAELLYFLTDHLGSTSVVVDEIGNVLQRSGYAPYGELMYLVDGSWNAIVDSLTIYMYTRQEFDSDDVYYYGARYYDPVLGRFLQADTILDGMNRYAYCGNNPVRYVDPTGHGMDYSGAEPTEYDSNTWNDAVSSISIFSELSSNTGSSGTDNSQSGNSDNNSQSPPTLEDIIQAQEGLYYMSPTSPHWYNGATRWQCDDFVEDTVEEHPDYNLPSYLGPADSSLWSPEIGKMENTIQGDDWNVVVMIDNATNVGHAGLIKRNEDNTVEFWENGGTGWNVNVNTYNNLEEFENHSIWDNHGYDEL